MPHTWFVNKKQPILQPPGAGLPWWENLIARLLFRSKCRLREPADFAAEFTRERQTIAALLSPLAENTLRQQVLIRRLPGLEDSSRDWSIAMTLDHLRIVHGSMAGVLRALAAGQRPPGIASTAAVKPSPDADAATIPRYEQSCDALLACVAEISSFRTRTTFPHPWFGEMDAHAWWALAAGHMGIHRRQIEAILHQVV
jgi:hypothetical protein